MRFQPKYIAAKINKEESPANLTDRELLFSHALTHAFWKRIQLSETVRNWSREDILNYHQLLIMEMKNRGFKTDPKDEISLTFDREMSVIS